MTPYCKGLKEEISVMNCAFSSYGTVASSTGVLHQTDKKVKMQMSSLDNKVIYAFIRLQIDFALKNS